ncbi:hypothetical protein [Dehalobacterium formicoaceticum]|uniref:hypothetical protein n=1 Tax=Dehalobacterium formicoaceticum TaxID=51515 RepID=UPI000B7F712E|nr:hypothetical protein [Dehalobacterium formicoaceticum]
MKLIQNYQDEKTNKYIIISQVLFVFLAGIFVLNIRQATFNNFQEAIVLMSAILISSIILISLPVIKFGGGKYAWLVELMVFLIFFRDHSSLFRRGFPLSF